MLVVQRQGAKAPRLSLSELAAMNPHAHLLPKVKGWVQCTVRKIPDCPRCGASAVRNHELGVEAPAVRYDETRGDYVCDACGLDHGIEKGPIVKQVAQENLVTRAFWQMLWFDYYGFSTISTASIMISNDDTGVHELKDICNSCMNSSVTYTGVAASKNTVSEYYTYTCTFSAPTSARTIRQVGLNGLNNSANAHATNSNVRSVYASSITELSSPIEQGPTETFEVVYKYQFSEVTP